MKGERLIIRVDASTQMGTGHLMRCLALAQAWEDAGGEAIFITACHSEVLLQRLRDEGIGIHLLAHSYPDSDDWNCTKDLLTQYLDAWVVLDGYHFDEIYQQQVKEAGRRLLVIDDMAHLRHYYADIMLNQNLGARQLHYPGDPCTHLLLGTRYALLRREFLAWKGWRRGIPKVARRVLVTLGGSDPENNTLKVIKALREVDVLNLEAIVIIGASNPHAEVLEVAARKSRLSIHLTCNAQNMPGLMAQADMAVAVSGISAWELAFMGLPSLVLRWADNQRSIAKELNAAGVALDLGLCSTLTTEGIRLELVKLAQSADARAEMSQRGQQLIDGNGGQRVVATMIAGVAA